MKPPRHTPARLLYITLLLTLALTYAATTYGALHYMTVGAHEGAHCYAMHERATGMGEDVSPCEIYIEDGATGYIMTWTEGSKWEHAVIHSASALLVIGAELPALTLFYLAWHAARHRPAQETKA